MKLTMLFALLMLTSATLILARSQWRRNMSRRRVSRHDRVRLQVTWSYYLRALFALQVMTHTGISRFNLFLTALTAKDTTFSNAAFCRNDFHDIFVKNIVLEIWSNSSPKFLQTMFTSFETPCCMF